MAEISVLNNKKAPPRKKSRSGYITPLANSVKSPIWLSVSETAKIGGVAPKTIRRAIQAQKIPYKIVNNRYLIDLAAGIRYLYTNAKLRNKLNMNGIGQYIDKWRD